MKDMTMQVPIELVEQFVRGNGVIFVGSRLSQQAGLPGWQELLMPLAERIKLPGHLRTDPLMIAQHYENNSGRQALVSYVIEQMDTTSIRPTDNHRRLLRLGEQTWITTNYDDLIEQTFREAGKPFNKVVRDQDLPYTTGNAITLVKLYGDREQPDTLIITQQDYHTYFRRYPRVKDKLTGLLLEKTFFFVGYELDDPDFRQIQAEIAFDLQQHQRRAYAVVFEADEFTITDLSSRNIQAINISLGDSADWAQCLGVWLDTLSRQIEKERLQKEQSPLPVVPEIPSFQMEEVRSLLEAMGYRILDARMIGVDCYFLCAAKWGAEIRQEIVHFVGDTPTPGDIAALNDAVLSHNALRGTLLTYQPLSDAMRELVRQREHIHCYTLDEFTNRLADFRPYLERLIREYETSEIPQYYVPLSVKRTDVENQKIQVSELESFVDTWLTESNHNHLSILGDFGSGKTWFCQRYAYVSAKRYFADPVHNRIPILITLRDYSRSYDAEQLITDAITNHYKVGLAAGYKTFARLNEAGKVLLIFDGFDEMEQRVSDYRTTVENFWELAKVVSSKSKVFLTCRTTYFRHQREEETILRPRVTTVNIISNDRVIDLRNREGFEVAHLADFGEESIRSALQKRLPVAWQVVLQQIQSLPSLRDLASRPVLLDMIAKTLPQIRDVGQVNQATLYAVYIDKLLKRRLDTEAEFIPPEDRLFFMQELAWDMYTNQRLKIPFAEFPDLVISHFSLNKSDPERVAFFERDIRTQSYLVRDDADEYYFAHQSFVEYFVACKLVKEISNPHFTAEESIVKWKNHFFGEHILFEMPAIFDFVVGIIRDTTVLWKIVDATRDKRFSEVGYAGSNAATILNRQKESFKGRKLSGAFLPKTDFRNGNLVNVDFSHASLEDANFEYTDLRYAKLVGTNLRSTNLSCADFRNAVLERANLSEARGENVNFSSANLDEAEIFRADFSDGRFIGASLVEASVRETEVINCDFTGADCSMSYFRHCVFDRCNFAECDFERADLKKTDLIDCILEDTSFAGAKLLSTNFESQFDVGSVYFDEQNWQVAIFRGEVLRDLQHLMVDDLDSDE